MSNLPISASAPVRVNAVEITPLVVNGQRVLTLAMIDQIHARPEGTAGRNFRENRHRLVAGEDYVELTADEIRRQSLDSAFPARTPMGLVFTESGYLLLVKSFTDDLAWRIQRELVNAYFRHPAPTAAHIPQGTRFVATHDGKSWWLREIPRDAAVLPMAEWPREIAGPDFPRDLLPQVLTAVGQRMQGLPAPIDAQKSNRKTDIYDLVLLKVIEAKADGIQPGHLPAVCKAFRDLSQEKRANLVDRLVRSGEVREVSFKPKGRGRPSKRLVAAKYLKKEG